MKVTFPIFKRACQWACQVRSESPAGQGRCRKFERATRRIKYEGTSQAAQAALSFKFELEGEGRGSRGRIQSQSSIERTGRERRKSTGNRRRRKRRAPRREKVDDTRQPNRRPSRSSRTLSPHKSMNSSTEFSYINSMPVCQSLHCQCARQRPPAHRYMI